MNLSLNTYLCMSSVTLGVHGLSEKGLVAHVVPLSSAVVCIESIPAYAVVVDLGYYSWCMSGSLAGQFRLWYALRVYQLMLG